MSELDDKIREAEEAIDAVFSDLSVSQMETAQNLRDLQGYIDVMVDTLP